MHKFGKSLARLLAVLLAVAFCILAVLALILTGLERHLTDPEIYKDALAGQQVYARLPRILAEQLVTQANYNPCAANPLLCENASQEFLNCALSKVGQERFDALGSGSAQLTAAERENLQGCIDSYGGNLQAEQAGQGGAPEFIQALGVSEWETVIRILFPEGELQATAENVLDQFFAYLDGQQENVVLSLVPLRNRISGQPGLDAVVKVLRDQPACSDAEYEQLARSLSGQAGETRLCAPNDRQLEPMLPLIQAQLAAYARSLPEQSVLLDAESGENTNQAGPLGTGPLGNLRGMRVLMRLSPLLPLFLLLLITLLVIRTPRAWLRWWGIPLLACGLLAGLALGSASGILERVWLAQLAERIPPYLSLGLVTLVQDLVSALLRSVFGRMTFSAILLGLLGLAMWIVSFFLKGPSGQISPEGKNPASTDA